MLTRSHSNTEVKREICFHIKIYLSYDFFQKFSCWLRNISLKVTRMRETFNSWNNYFQNLKASEAYYEEGFYSSSCHERDTREKVPFSESNLRTSDSRSSRRVWVETKGWIPPENSGSFLCSTLVTRRKKKTICLTHQQAPKFTKFLILVPSYYSYEELRRRQVLLTIFNDFTCKKKLRRRWW